MKDNVWGYLFAGVSALAGIIYLIQATRGNQGNGTTNVFPPLNAPQYAIPGTEGVSPTNATLPGATEGAQNPNAIPTYAAYLV
jgi:hypothetical protein